MMRATTTLTSILNVGVRFVWMFCCRRSCKSCIRVFERETIKGKTITKYSHLFQGEKENSSKKNSKWKSPPPPSIPSSATLVSCCKVQFFVNRAFLSCSACSLQLLGCKFPKIMISQVCVAQGEKKSKSSARSSSGRAKVSRCNFHLFYI